MTRSRGNQDLFSLLTSRARLSFETYFRSQNVFSDSNIPEVGSYTSRMVDLDQSLHSIAWHPYRIPMIAVINYNQVIKNGVNEAILFI